MAALREAGRLAAVSLAVVVSAAGGCGTAAPGSAGGTNATDNSASTNGPADDGSDAEPAEFVAINEGGGDLAERLGGAIYTGEAIGPIAGGTLTLIFAADGALASLGGTVLGSFLGLGPATEVIFGYETGTVSGTYQAADGASQPLAEFLAGSQQSIALRSVVVMLVGDSLSVVTRYAANLSGQPQGEQTITLEGTVRFQTNEDIIGGLILPGYLDANVPEFTLPRE